MSLNYRLRVDTGWPQLVSVLAVEDGEFVHTSDVDCDEALKFESQEEASEFARTEFVDAGFSAGDAWPHCVIAEPMAA